MRILRKTVLRGVLRVSSFSGVDTGGGVGFVFNTLTIRVDLSLTRYNSIGVVRPVHVRYELVMLLED